MKLTLLTTTTAVLLASTSTPQTLSDEVVTDLFLYVILPSLLLYIGLVVYAAHKDRWKR